MLSGNKCEKWCELFIFMQIILEIAFVGQLIYVFGMLSEDIHGLLQNTELHPSKYVSEKFCRIVFAEKRRVYMIFSTFKIEGTIILLKF